MWRFGRWLQVRRNFLVFSVLAFGVPFGLLSVRYLLRGEQLKEPVSWLILVAAGLLVGYFWGLFMWPIFEAKLKQSRETIQR